MNPWEEYAQPVENGPWQEYTAQPSKMLPENVAIPEKPASAAPKRTLTEQLLRSAGLAARAGVTGVTGTGAMLADPLVALANKAFGSNLPAPSEAQQGMLTRLGLPVPETTGERIATGISSLLAGAKDPLAAAIQARIAPTPLVPRMAPPNPRAEQIKTFQEAANEGYINTPSIAKAGAGSRTLEAIGGKNALQQQTQMRNQAVTDAIAVREAGLPKNTPLTKEILEASIGETYRLGYDPIKAVGTVTNGGIYRRALDNAMTKFQGSSASFPATANQKIADLIDSYRVQQFDAGEAIDRIKALRKAASDAYANNDSNLGGANLAISKALEDSIDLNLKASGTAGQGLLAAYRAARANLAKQFAVRDAVLPGSGSVNASYLAKQLANNEPLTGGLRTIAKFATNAPQLTSFPKNPPGMLTGPESWAIGAGGIGRALVGGPISTAMVAAPILRAGLRQGLMTSPYQKAFMHQNLQPGMVAQLFRNPGVRNAIPTGFELGSGLFGQE